MQATHDPATLKSNTAAVSERRQLYESYLGASGFAVKIGDKTCFDHTTRTVVLAESELSQAKDARLINFDVFHELGHFMQLAQDPEGYLSLIKGCKGDRKDAEFEFYNCVLDVDVNSRVANRSPVYRGEDGYSALVKDYYQGELFKEHNLTNLPLHQQFSYMILLTGMSSAEQYTVSPEVKGILDSKLNVFGNEKTFSDFVKESFKEPIEYSVDEFTVSTVKTLADDYLKPIWEDLYRHDHAKGKQRGEGVLKPQMFSEGDIKNAIDAAFDANDKRNASPDQINKNQIKAAVKSQLLEESPVTDDLAERFARMQGQIAELAELWRDLRHVQVSGVIVEEAGHTTGHALSIPKVISQFSGVQRGVPDLPIMIRQGIKYEQSVQPKKTRIFIALDQSGSMDSSQTFVKDEFVALAGSVISYNFTKEPGDPELEVCIYKYSDDASSLAVLDSSTKISDLLTPFKKLIPEGGTESHKALELIHDTVRSNPDPEVFNLLIEVTDGETKLPALSKQKLDELTSLGVCCCGIKFLGAIGSDTPNSQIVNSGGSFRTMYPEGAEIMAHKFPTAMRNLLSAYIDKPYE